ncbi:hypothetical protein Tco_0196722 [Tanacetum coccineum]
MIRETMEKIMQIKNRLLTAHSRQKSYADVRRKLMEFSVGDIVMLKNRSRGDSFWKPMESVAYKLELPHELRGIHNTFHVSNLKKCLADENLIIPLEEIQLDDKLHFIKEPIEIMDREVKHLKQSRIPIIKVRWNSRRGLEFTWEREDFFKSKYLHLFVSKRNANRRNRAPGWRSRRKAHLLEDKQIPSVGYLMSIWKAFGGNTRDLGSFGEETDKSTDLHQHLLRLCSQRLETTSPVLHDAVTTHFVTASQPFTTASARTTQPKI